MDATGHATDPLGLTAAGTTTVTAGGPSSRTIRTSLLGTRVNWGNSIDQSTNGPDLTYTDAIQAPAGPVTLGITATVLANARITGMRVYKHPNGTGSVTFALWDNTGSLLRSVTEVWASDTGGWRTVEFAPLTVTAGQTFNWGYHYPTTNSNYAVSPWVWNNGQDTTVYPLFLANYTETGAGARAGGLWMRAGTGLTYGDLSTDRRAANYFIDPIVEYDITMPGYTSGTTYWDQFTHGGSRFGFPVAVFFSDPENLADYKALGVNTLVAGYTTGTYIDEVIAADMDWYPTITGGDMSAPIAVQEDTSLATRVRGYLLTDEPDLITPFNSPATLRAWRNACRRIDSTRPIFLNLSRYALINQGFTWQPVGITSLNANLQWREFMQLADVGSLDAYSLAGTDSFEYRTADPMRYGIWTYPLIIKRMRNEITDQRIPIWGVVETTSSFAGTPTATQVQRATWASLIAGATGIMYFDHRFTSPQVTQDFAAMLSDATMSSTVTALNAQMQTYATALTSPEMDYIEGYTSTGTMAAAQGGYPATAPVPFHYATRRPTGGTTYIWIQAIRAGSTSGTFLAPSLAGATLTVVGESRTVTVNGSGYFTDAFTSGDYTYHLYTTTFTPITAAPTNTVAPAITDDSTPATDETITTSHGTWTAAPSPVFTYQWQRSTNGGTTWSDISGATYASYTLTVTDEGTLVRSRVTATNSVGSASANSSTISPTSGAVSLFIDTFNRADGAAGNGWTSSAGGSLTIASNALDISGYAGYSRVYQGGLPRATSVRAIFTGSVVGFQGIMCAYSTTTSTGLKLFYNGTVWQIGNAEGPYEQNTTLTGVPSAPWTDLRIDFNGSQVAAWVNGTQVLAPTLPATLGIPALDTSSSSIYQCGYVGEAGHTDIDNFEVWTTV